MTTLKQDVLQKLTRLIFPEHLQEIGSFLRLSEVKETPPTLFFEIPGEQVGKASDLEDFLKTSFPEISIILTAHKKAPKVSPKQAPQKVELEDVKDIILVASGKGGVGKSTVAANLALSFAADGLKVGILDADLHGPSLPKILNLEEKPQSDGKKITPVIKYGIKCLSIGLMMPEDKALIWRGPMVQGTLLQMLRDVYWEPLDILIIDMPPGTGDAHLSVGQYIKPTGAVVVSTPQDLSLLDARKCLQTYEELKIPVLGLIENMSTFVCPHCKNETPIFSHGTLKKEATKRNVSFLGEISLDLSLRESSETGTPVSLSNPTGPIAQSFFKISKSILKEMHKQTAA